MSKTVNWKKNLFICFFGAFSTVFAMTIMLPFLPLYIELLGVKGHSEIIQFSGIAYSCVFISAGLIAPFWGKLGDKYGRKAMLIRASLGMALMTMLLGFVNNIEQLLFCLLIMGLAGGYSSGATILVAAQTPKEHSGWALATIASGGMADNVLGPLVGGYLPSILGIRETFWFASVLILITFLLTTFYLKEEKKENINTNKKISFKNIPNKKIVACMLFTGFLFMFSNYSIEPILPLYIKEIILDNGRITQMSGIVLSATALGSICSAVTIGKFADQIGHQKVIIISLFLASICLLPQAFVTEIWQLILLRFLMGLSLGGLLPCITSTIRHKLSSNTIGTVIGFSISAQFLGQFFGPLSGGYIGSYIGSYIGFSYVFIITSCLLIIGALANWIILKNSNSNI